jgi:chaperone required for assembly of F1-ATPase
MIPSSKHLKNNMKDARSTIQAEMKRERPKRFYKDVHLEVEHDAYLIKLDGKMLHTPARRIVSLPSKALAEAIEAEWAAQGEYITLADMPLTMLAYAAMDRAVLHRDMLVEELIKYAGSDLICYRASSPESLVSAQSAAWDPVLAWASEALGARFMLSEGVMFVEQPEASLASIKAAIEAVQDPFDLACLHVITTLTGSVLLSLAHFKGLLDAQSTWQAAHVDELFQETRWGQDEEAMKRQKLRMRDFTAASNCYKLKRESAI